MLLVGGLEVREAPAEERAQGIGSAGPVDGLAVRRRCHGCHWCHRQ
jgi:hypothetical protein